MSLHVIDETDDWIVVDKPPFLEAHPSKPNGRATLWHGLRELLAFELVNGGQVSLINRLDRETSGLTLVAKTRGAARSLHLQMEARRFQKEYLAIVWGWPAQGEFAIDAPILRQGSRGPSRIYLKQAVHPDGASARTSFRVEQRFTAATSNGSRFALIRAFPETGRMHQIRVHLAHAGFPVVGDKLYGPDEACYLEFIETGWTPALASRLLLPRHALHSAALRLPTRGLGWQSPLAPDLAAWLAENLRVTREGQTL
ncbi:MAG TPA: RNA pseudouridine synthase [Chthoniobacteraceae bacterium]|nr:RNA pseudouridine synthase [Chthoniobacteraceae bacterium]